MKSIKQPYYMFAIILFCLFMFWPIKSQAAGNDATLINGNGFAIAIYNVVQAASKSRTDVQHIVYDATPSTEILNATSYEVVSESGPEIRMCFTPSTGTIHIYPIAPVDVIYLNEDATHMFSYLKPESGSGSSSPHGLSSCQDIDTSWFDTSKVTTMREIFFGCQKLTSLDVSGFNTSNVTDMSWMFFSCSALTSLDVSGLDTSNVTNMNQMFYNCYKLTSLDVSGFDTSNVTDMNHMFYNCRTLTSLDVSGFDTTNVTNMREMFADCVSLTSLDISGLNTANVTNMSCMFEFAEKLQTIDVSNFNTSNVTDMSHIFDGCLSLTRLDISNFDLSDTSMLYFVNGCESLTYLKTPASLQYSFMDLDLPTKNETTWTIEDGTVVTKCLVDGQPHTYKRSDYVEPVMSGSNPNQMSIPVTMDVDSYYEVSAPALLCFSRDEFEIDANGDNFVSYDTIDNNNTWQSLDNENTYYACDMIRIEGHGSSNTKVRVNITPPVMTNNTDQVKTQFWTISANMINTSSEITEYENDVYTAFSGGVSLDQIDTITEEHKEALAREHQFCLDNNYTDKLAEKYFDAFDDYDNFWNYKRQFLGEDNKTHAKYWLPISAALDADHPFTCAFSLGSSEWDGSYIRLNAVIFTLRGTFNQTGTYTGNMAVNFRFE